MLDPGCVLADLASIKAEIAEYYRGCGRRFASVHPMFGPTFADLKRQRAGAGETRSSSASRTRTRSASFRALFERLGLRLFEYSFAEHDRMMAYSLTTPFASSLVFARLHRRHRGARHLLRPAPADRARAALEDDELLAEILFNPRSLAQLRAISSRLEALEEIIRAATAKACAPSCAACGRTWRERRGLLRDGGGRGGRRRAGAAPAHRRDPPARAERGGGGRGGLAAHAQRRGTARPGASWRCARPSPGARAAPVEEVVVGPGSKHLLFALMSVVAAGPGGGAVATPRPTWPAYGLMARQLGLKLQALPSRPGGRLELRPCERRGRPAGGAVQPAEPDQHGVSPRAGRGGRGGGAGPGRGARARRGLPGASPSRRSPPAPERSGSAPLQGVQPGGVAAGLRRGRRQTSWRRSWNSTS
jgi:hypothetical protein